MHDYIVLDVFTNVPLEGNQLAVFSDAAGIDDALMQRTARELNLSETVFVFAGDRECDGRIRIFTPGAELPFAGHPVLGTAFVVGERLGLDQVRLGTGRGVVTVALERDSGNVVFGEMEQPIPVVSGFEYGRELLVALGATQSEPPAVLYDNGPRNVFVMLGSEAEVASLKPDMGALAALGALNVSCVAGTGERYKTRMFAPGIGIAEDPATGSAAGPLALHLALSGRIAFGQRIEITQGVEIQRPSLLYARVDGGADSIDRVRVGGGAVIVARGCYRLG